MSKIWVQKYGGSSLAGVEKISHIAEFIDSCTKDGWKVVAVVSAMAGQTDYLMGLAYSLAPQPSRREIDVLLSAGERVSMALLGIALENRGIPSSSLTGSQVGILTQGPHGNARISSILGNRVRETLDTGKVSIVAGFQGVDPVSKDITTLGRGGTDLTALALAYSLGAEKVDLFKDVDGIMPFDPNLTDPKNLKPLSKISTRSLKKLVERGAKVVQPRAAFVAHKFEIPFTVRSSLDFERPGTTVYKERLRVEKYFVESMTLKENLMGACIDLERKHLSSFFELLYGYFEELGVHPFYLFTEMEQEKAQVKIILTAEMKDCIQALPLNCSGVVNVDCLAEICCLSLIGSGFSTQSLFRSEVLSRAVTSVDMINIEDDRVDLYSSKSHCIALYQDLQSVEYENHSDAKD